MSTTLLLLGLFAAIVTLAVLATRTRLPYAILLVLGGAALGFLPGLPRIALDPDLVLLLFLPPLVFSSAWLTSWREFRATLRPILLLSVGLVLVTTVFIAVVAHLALGFSWPVAFVLGAVVSPTDAVAASATSQRLGLARRIVTVIEGESVVNDATGLVVYRFAVVAVVTGTFSLWQASLQFLLVSGGGLLIGLVIGILLAWLHRRLDDAPIEITLTILTPFAAYVLAEALQVSGVLAALAAGLLLSRQSSRFFSSNTRLQANAVWAVLVFLLNGLVFLLIGLQLRIILETVVTRAPLTLISDALLICLAVILVRIAWVFPATYLPRWLSPRLRRRDPYPGWRNVAVVAWTGLRGGVSLAAALALPLVIAGGKAFPERDLLIFLTFCVILATLVVQGLSLGPLIRLLQLKKDTTFEQEHAQAHLAAIQAAQARLNELASEEWVHEDYLMHLRSYYEEQEVLNTARLDGGTATEEMDHATAHNRLRQEVLKAERATVIRLRDQGHIDDEVLRLVERELDLEEQQLQGHR
jgi:CPA1 family monovalent cation:H+ antiporter